MLSGNTGVVKELAFSEGPAEVWEEGAQEVGKEGSGHVPSLKALGPGSWCPSPAGTCPNQSTH